MNTSFALIFVLNSQESKNQQYEYLKNNIMQIFGKHKSISWTISTIFIYKKDDNIAKNDFNEQRGEIQTEFN